jgi:hypothetical protein
MAIQTATDLEQELAASINAERAAAGLAPLKIEAHLNASAQAHSDWMAGTGKFSHAGEGGSSATERIDEAGFPLTGSWQTAENIAYISITGDLDSGEADRMHDGLMESEGHRENILDPGAAYVGIGLAPGTINLDGIDHEVVFLTENFADTDGEVLVQEEVDGQAVLQPYQDGEPVGDPIAAEEEPPQDPDEEEQEPVSASAGGCFVATAAYGSWSHPDVVALRRFRDEVLAAHAAGRAFIRAYRFLGPKLARRVSPTRPSGRAARALIAPLARLARRRTGATGSP